MLQEFLALDDQLALPDMIKAQVNLAKLLLLLERPDEAEALVDQVLVEFVALRFVGVSFKQAPKKLRYLT